MGKVIGIDLGDRKSHYCVLNEDGIVIEEGAVQTTPAAFLKHFADVESSLIALEVCGHSR
jgi:predicted NBD/HSP70 family sugar kinase